LCVDVDVPGTGTWWCVKDQPVGLSVNAAHNVLVTCDEVRKIKEFSSRGVLVRELIFPDGIINAWHTIQLTNDQLIVCHGDPGDAVHRVCKVSADGDVIQSHGGLPGSDIGQCYLPRHLSVDSDEFVFVADQGNGRVTLLLPSLDFILEVVSPDDLTGFPTRLYLDIQRRRLYVADDEYEDGKFTAGCVVVFSV